MERWTANLFHTDWDIHMGAYILDKDTFNTLQFFSILNCAIGHRLTVYVARAKNAQIIVLMVRKM